MDKNVDLRKMAAILKRKGFEKITFNPIVTSLNWSFDIFAEKKNEAIAVEFRKNDNIPDIFIERINKIKKFSKKLTIYLIFQKKPRNSTISLLKDIGIGIMVFHEKRFYYLSSSRDFSRKKAIPKKKRRIKEKPMHQIFVYPSSKQYEQDGKSICKERNIICKIIRNFNQTHGIAIHPKLVECDMRNDRKFKLKITKNLKESHIFIGVIREMYSKYVEYEMRKVFSYIDDMNLILILKKNMISDDIDDKEKQTKLIKFVQSKTSHIPYSNLNDFESQVSNKLIKMIDLLYKKNRSKSPFGF